MKTNSKLNFIAKLCLFGSALIWGSSFIVFKFAIDSIPSNFALALRFTVACFVLCLIFHKKLKRLNKQYMKKGLIIGFFLFAAYCSQTLGLSNTTPGKNAFLTAIYCVLVPFLYWFIDKVKPDIYNFISAVLCITGIGLVSLTSGLTIGIGDSLTLLGGFLFAAHMVAIAKYGKESDPILITILQFGFAAIFCWITTFLFEPIPSMKVFTLPMIGSLLYLALFCTAITILLQNIGQKYTNPSSAAIILSLESVFGVFFSVLLYGESLTPRLLVGFVLIFIAVIISETKLSFITKRRLLS